MLFSKCNIGITQGAIRLKNLFDGGYWAMTPYLHSELNGVIIIARYANTFHYYIRDYQGNNRVVVNDSCQVEQTNDYYAYGGPWGDTSTNQGFQPFKYNGKELDRVHGLDWYDYGARRYDPACAQFTQMDPLCEQYPHLSPYAYCAGNPIRYVDLDGLNPIYNEHGKFLGTDDTGIAGPYYILKETDFVQGMSHYDVGDLAINEVVSDEIIANIDAHFSTLSTRPDYDGFVSVEEGIAWAKAHPYALKNPTPDNTLYIDASKLDFGSLSTSQFKNVGTSEPQNLFVNRNIAESSYNPKLFATVYALGRVDMILTNRKDGTVKIVNNSATDYDWNLGGGFKRNIFIKANNFIFNLKPHKHGFKTFYYGKGHLNY